MFCAAVRGTRLSAAAIEWGGVQLRDEAVGCDTGDVGGGLEAARRGRRSQVGSF